MSPAALIVPLVLVAIVAIRFLADRADRTRIRADVEGRGGEVIDITWKPFGRGWFGEKSDRVYLVEWLDDVRRTHTSWCKTSAFSGVYWTEEGAPSGGPARELDALRDENRRLRAELERLRRGR
jgi:hypothetical protein